MKGSGENVTMDNQELVILTETVERSKSNTHQIEELKDEVKEKLSNINAEIKEIKSEQKAIYEIAASVKLIAQDMGTMKESINDVKQGQSKLEQKIDEVDEKSKVDILETKRNNIKQNIAPFLLGGGSITAIIYIISEIIKMLAK